MRRGPRAAPNSLARSLAHRGSKSAAVIGGHRNRFEKCVLMRVAQATRMSPASGEGVVHRVNIVSKLIIVSYSRNLEPAFHCRLPGRCQVGPARTILGLCLYGPLRRELEGCAGGVTDRGHQASSVAFPCSRVFLRLARRSSAGSHRCWPSDQNVSVQWPAVPL